MKHTDYLRSLDELYLKNLVSENTSFRGVLKCLGIIANSNRIKILKERVERVLIETTHFDDRIGFQEKFLNSELFVEKSNIKINRSTLKSRILKDDLIDYKCRDCSNAGTWRNKHLTLRLEHINGINTDNRLENLCFLCPNCHSQTETYSKPLKNRKKK